MRTSVSALALTFLLPTIAAAQNPPQPPTPPQQQPAPQYVGQPPPVYAQPYGQPVYVQPGYAPQQQMQGPPPGYTYDRRGRLRPVAGPRLRREVILDEGQTMPPGTARGTRIN